MASFEVAFTALLGVEVPLRAEVVASAPELAPKDEFPSAQDSAVSSDSIFNVRRRRLATDCSCNSECNSHQHKTLIIHEKTTKHARK